MSTSMLKIHGNTTPTAWICSVKIVYVWIASYQMLNAIVVDNRGFDWLKGPAATRSSVSRCKYHDMKEFFARSTG
jgi:hypothetical protein